MSDQFLRTLWYIVLVCCLADDVVFHEDKFAAVEKPATIRCHSSRSSAVLWEFRSSAEMNVRHVYDRKLTSSYEHRCTVDERAYDLIIHTVEVSDTGEYLCIEDEGFGTKHVTKLYVTGKKQLSFDMFFAQSYLENNASVISVMQMCATMFCVWALIVICLITVLLCT